MKKIALSLMVIAASGAYVWNQARKPVTGDLETLPPPAADQTIVSSAIPLVNLSSAPPKPLISLETQRDLSQRRSSFKDANTRTPIKVKTTTVVASRRERAQQVSAPDTSQANAAEPPAPVEVAAVSGAYADGVYSGPAVDAYYGLVQIQAIVNGGQLVGIKVLQYPSDRRTSVAINRQALPMLRSEAIAAQSAQVDAISGATLTSEAFIESLSGALREARPNNA